MIHAPTNDTDRRMVVAAEVTLSPLPECKNPARVYIGSLAEGASQVTMESTLRLLAKMIGGPAATIDTVPWQELRYEHVARLRSALAAKHAAATANKYLAALRGTLEAAWKLELIDTDAFTRAVKVDNVKGSSLPSGRALVHAELDKLSDAIADDHGRKGPLSTRDAAILAVMYNTGVRRSELVNFDLADYKRDDLSLHVRHGKGNKARMVYLDATARDALDGWLKTRGEEAGPLFMPILKSGAVVPRRLCPESLLKIMKVRGAQAGIADYGCHDLRRSFVTDMIDAGVPLNTVRDAAGHSSIITTSRYDRSGEKAKMKAAKVLRVPYTRPVAV